VLAAATTRERVARLLAVCAAQGIEPRGVIAAPTAFARVAERLAALGGPEAKDDAVMILDVGHLRTDLCIVRRGRAIFARTLSRGGRHVTQAIAKAWNLSPEDAEQAKHTDGFVASRREPAMSEAWDRISKVITQDLAPLLRDLRQTMAACRAQSGTTVKRAVVCGGGGRLRGLASWLSEELNLPVGTITADDAPRLLGAADTELLPLGVALEGATGRPSTCARGRSRTRPTTRSCAPRPATSPPACSC
jgi:Tfp pilus assembly PilM family ATPase